MPRRIATTVTTALATAALTVPAAAQDLRSPDARDAAASAVAAQQSSQDLRSPDARDAGRPLPVGEPRLTAPTVVELPSPGFNWGDAAIGAAGMLAVVALAAGLAMIVTTRRRPRVPAT